MGTESFRNNTGFVGIVAFRQFLPGYPLELVSGGEYVGRVSASGRASTLTAMTDVKRIKRTAHDVLNSATEARTFEFLIHNFTSILAPD
jgi:hypothetical protein